MSSKKVKHKNYPKKHITCNVVGCGESESLEKLEDEKYCPYHISDATTLNKLINDNKYTWDGVAAMEYKVAATKKSSLLLTQELSAIKVWLEQHRPMPVLYFNGVSIAEATYIQYLFALL